MPRGGDASRSPGALLLRAVPRAAAGHRGGVDEAGRPPGDRGALPVAHRAHGHPPPRPRPLRRLRSGGRSAPGLGVAAQPRTTRTRWVAPSRMRGMRASGDGSGTPSTSTRRDAAGDAARVLDRDLVARGVVAEGDLEAAATRAGCTGRDGATAPRRRKPEDPLEPGAVHPARRAGVPGPAAAPDVRRLGVDVGGDDVGLDLVAVDARARARVVDRVQDREELAGLVAVARARRRPSPPRPRRGCTARRSRGRRADSP